MHKRKNISFGIELNEEQKIGKEEILNNDITILIGRAGSGKTQLAVLTALDMFNNKEVEKIVVTRPAISKEKLGFMPGDLAEKMAPYMEPIKQCMYKAYEKRIGGKDKIDKHFQNNEFQILPIAFTRGVTYMDSVVIVDEFQNLELSEFKLVLTRLGKRSKLILTGAEDQIDLRFPEMSCVHHINKLQDIPGLKIFKLYENHRHPILDLIDKVL